MIITKESVTSTHSPLHMVLSDSTKPGLHLPQIGEEARAIGNIVLLLIDNIPPEARYVTNADLHLPGKQDTSCNRHTHSYIQ